MVWYYKGMSLPTQTDYDLANFGSTRQPTFKPKGAFVPKVVPVKAEHRAQLENIYIPRRRKWDEPIETPKPAPKKKNFTACAVVGLAIGITAVASCTGAVVAEKYLCESCQSK